MGGFIAMKAFKTFLRSPGDECSQKPSWVSNSSQDHLAGGTFEPGTWADLGLTTHDFKLFASPWGHGEKHRFTYIPKTKVTAQGGQDVQCSHLTLSQCHGTCWQRLLAVSGTSFSACQVARSLKNIISLLPVPRGGLHDVETMRGLDNPSLYSAVGTCKALDSAPRRSTSPDPSSAGTGTRPRDVHIPSGRAE